MTTYYRGPEVLITDKVFVVSTPERQAFPIGELCDCHVVRGDLHPMRVYTAHAAGGALLVAAASWPMIHTPTGYAAMIVLVAAPSALSGACCRLNPRAYELRATYRGLSVRLYCSTDLAAFGQVKRALVRAFEARESQLEQLGEAGYLGS